MKTHVGTAASVLVVIMILCAVAFVNRESIIDKFLLVGSYSGPHTLAEVTKVLSEERESLPIYLPKPSSAYSALMARFYYFDLVDKTWIDTYLLDLSMPAETNRVVRIRTSLTPPALDFVMSGSKRVPVSWANNAEASTCAVKPFDSGPDHFKGKSYETCLTWWSGKDTFQLYSSLPLEDTLALVNSLERVR